MAKHPDMPKRVKRALLVFQLWAKENGYNVFVISKGAETNKKVMKGGDRRGSRASEEE